MRPIRFTIHVDPHGKKNPIPTRGPFPGVTKSPETREWEEAFAALVRPFAPPTPLEGPVEIGILAVKARPKSLKRPAGLVWCPKKPDRSNVAKSVEDAMKEAGFYTDDNVIVIGLDITAYAEIGGRPRISVVVRRPRSTPFIRAQEFGIIA